MLIRVELFGDLAGCPFDLIDLRAASGDAAILCVDQGKRWWALEVQAVTGGAV